MLRIELSRIAFVFYFYSNQCIFHESIFGLMTYSSVQVLPPSLYSGASCCIGVWGKYEAAGPRGPYSSYQTAPSPALPNHSLLASLVYFYLYILHCKTINYNCIHYSGHFTIFSRNIVNSKLLKSGITRSLSESTRIFRQKVNKYMYRCFFKFHLTTNSYI